MTRVVLFQLPLIPKEPWLFCCQGAQRHEESHSTCCSPCTEPGLAELPLNPTSAKQSPGVRGSKGQRNHQIKQSNQSKPCRDVQEWERTSHRQRCSLAEHHASILKLLCLRACCVKFIRKDAHILNLECLKMAVKPIRKILDLWTF